MSDISAVSSLSDLSRDLYYQYLINHNSMSTMFDALSGNSDDSSDSSGLTSAIGSGLGYGLSSLNSIEGLDSLYGLSGVSRSDDSLLGLSQGISGFAGGSGFWVYITSSGNRFHTDPNCAALRRNVKSVKLSEVSDRHCCSRCAKQDDGGKS